MRGGGWCEGRSRRGSWGGEGGRRGSGRLSSRREGQWLGKAVGMGAGGSSRVALWGCVVRVHACIGPYVSR